MKMWCEDCKDEVEAVTLYDPDTGYRELQCPEGDWHALDELETCACGRPMAWGDELCLDCKEDVKRGWWALVKSLDPGLNTGSILDYITYDVMGG